MLLAVLALNTFMVKVILGSSVPGRFTVYALGLGFLTILTDGLLAITLWCILSALPLLHIDRIE